MSDDTDLVAVVCRGGHHDGYMLQVPRRMQEGGSNVVHDADARRRVPAQTYTITNRTVHFDDMGAAFIAIPLDAES